MDQTIELPSVPITINLEKMLPESPYKITLDNRDAIQRIEYRLSKLENQIVQLVGTIERLRDCMGNFNGQLAAQQEYARILKIGVDELHANSHTRATIYNSPAPFEKKTWGDTPPHDYDE